MKVPIFVTVAISISITSHVIAWGRSGSSSGSRSSSSGGSRSSSSSGSRSSSSSGSRSSSSSIQSNSIRNGIRVNLGGSGTRTSWWRGSPRTTLVSNPTLMQKLQWWLGGKVIKPDTLNYDRLNTYKNYKPFKQAIIKDPTDIKAVIRHFEGEPRLMAYNAQPKSKKVDLTIGIGFNLLAPDAEKTFRKVLPGVDFEKIKSGEASITYGQAIKLFDNAVNTKVAVAKRLFGEDGYNKLPGNVKAAVVNALYRGDLKSDVTKLMKAGNTREAIEGYLGFGQYQKAVEKNIPGVITRMNWNALQFSSMTQN